MPTWHDLWLFLNEAQNTLGLKSKTLLTDLCFSLASNHHAKWHKCKHSQVFFLFLDFFWQWWFFSPIVLEVQLICNSNSECRPTTFRAKVCKYIFSLRITSLCSDQALPSPKRTYFNLICHVTSSIILSGTPTLPQTPHCSTTLPEYKWEDFWWTPANKLLFYLTLSPTNHLMELIRLTPLIQIYNVQIMDATFFQ